MRVPKLTPAATLRRKLVNIAACLCLLFAVALLAPRAHAQRTPPAHPPDVQRAPARDVPQPPARQDDPQQPTLKKPDTVVVPPARERRRFDRERNATYLNIDIPLLSMTETKQRDGTAALSGRGLTLTFQLAYRGNSTDDLVAVYLILESTATRESADSLRAVARLEVRADPYEYAYERVNYQTELVETGGTGQGGPPLKRESAVFRALPEDLPQLTGSGRLELKLGPEAFTVKSQQLSELRRTLAAGVKD
jgi:hypothetical protein